MVASHESCAHPIKYKPNLQNEKIGTKTFVKTKQGFQKSLSGIGPLLNPHPLYKQGFDCGKYVVLISSWALTSPFLIGKHPFMLT